MISGDDKITQGHQDRLAYVYVRQSSSQQVRHNLESQRRQYELPRLIESLGWQPDRIVVLDEDLGHTASGLHERAGFRRLRTEVGEGEVGLVMGLETSRLARSNREWHHLLDLCAVCGTLVAEPGRIYDPRDYDDRLHLGLKGLLNEAELEGIKRRLVEALRQKAERGELSLTPPVGLVLDADGKPVLDPDLGVQQFFRTLFERFDELGSVRKVLRWILENEIKMPRRVDGKSLFSRVIWRLPTYNALRQMFANPRYAGAYVRGRRETYSRVEGGEPRSCTRSLPIEKWHVVIPGAHPGYISWEKFLSNRERIKQNSRRSRGAGRGFALLQKLIRCGRCGTYMQIHYGGERKEKNGVHRSYKCTRDASARLMKMCQSVKASLVEGVVQEAFLAALEPARLEVSVEALERLQQSTRGDERHWQLKLQRARDEAERAQRQYDQVEPENRLVAQDLERRWEEHLQELKRLEDEYGRWKQQKDSSWNAKRIGELRDLVKDVRALWNAASTSTEDRRELLRLLIEDVWLYGHKEERQIEVRILWKGGNQTVHRHAWWITGRGFKEDAIRRIRELSKEGLSAVDIAHRLNDEGYTRCDGRQYSFRNVNVIRPRYGIRKTKVPRPRESGVYNATEAARKLGVNPETITQWIRAGTLQATRQPQRGNEWRIEITQEVEAHLKGQCGPENEWTVAETSRHLGVPASKVYYWLDKGTLHARRARVGRRVRRFIPEKEVRKLEQRLATNTNKSTQGI